MNISLQLLWVTIKEHDCWIMWYLCDPVDYSPPGSFVHGILQARTLEWLPFPSPGDLPDPGTEPASPALAGGFFTTEPSGKPGG